MSTQHTWSTSIVSPPAVLFCRLLRFSNNEFIIVAQKGKRDDVAGIHKYNATTREWNKIMDYPSECITCHHLATIDDKNKTIYICNRNSNISGSKLVEINLSTKSIKHTDCNFDFGALPGIVFENNNIHIVGGLGQNRKHYILEKNNTLIHDFGSRVCAIDILKRTKSIIALKHSEDTSFMQYKNNEWVDMKVQCGYLFGSLNVAITENEDYIILLQGTNSKTSQMEDTIHVYDLVNNKLSKSNIKAPGAGSMATAVITRDMKQEEVITFGFVRWCYKGNDYKKTQELPFYLIKFIGKWLSCEIIHCIQVNGNGRHIHYTMDVNKIIESVL